MPEGTKKLPMSEVGDDENGDGHDGDGDDKPLATGRRSSQGHFSGSQIDFFNIFGVKICQNS